MSAIHGPQYHPRSVTVECRDGVWCMVDASYAGAEHVCPIGPTELDRARAHTLVRGRQATIRGALTRRRNKAKRAAVNARAAHIARRQDALVEAGVTWEWLREEMTEPEADAWLGIC